MSCFCTALQNLPPPSDYIEIAKPRPGALLIRRDKDGTKRVAGCCWERGHHHSVAVELLFHSDIWMAAPMSKKLSQLPAQLSKLELKVQPIVKLNAYAVISRAVEEGVTYGYNRAHKHTETPTEDQMVEAIQNAVMSALCEVMVFNEED